MACSRHVRDRGSRFGQLGVRHGSFAPGSVSLRHACLPAPGYGIADHGMAGEAVHAAVRLRYTARDA